MNVHSPHPSEAIDGGSFAAEMRPALVRYFRRKSASTTEAEDLAQDVIASTLNHSLCGSAAELKGYIFRAAANRWRDRLRRNVTRTGSEAWEEQNSELPRELITPERVLTAEQELNQVTTALLQLDERTRNVLLLVRLEQMKIDSVAQMLGISRSAVNRLLAKALAHVHATGKIP